MNAELIKALRCDGTTCRDECPYSNGREWCDEVRMIKDAADALEAAEKRIAELQQIADHYEQSAKDYWEEACEYKAQIPKEGEWEERYIEDANPMFRRRFYCSRCGEWTTHGKTRYCPNCGARMKGEE